MNRLFSSLSRMKLPINILPATGKTHSGTVIFFHGSGDTGSNLIEWIRFLLGKDMQFPYIKVVIPTAPVQPYTPLDGEPSNVWFDREAISIDVKECQKSMNTIYEAVKDLIQTEIDHGIPINRIIVGGFSMGGALSLHAGYHLNPNLGGVFALSSFLNNDSVVYDSLKSYRKGNPNATLPKLLMFHGERDSLVPAEWGRRTFERLKSFNVTGEFIMVKNTMHELKTQELLDLQTWILDTLPPLDNDLSNKL